MSLKRWLVIGFLIGAGALLSAQITNVLNSAADLSGKTLVTAEGNRVISGTFTFSVPVKVAAGTSVVPGIQAGIDASTGLVIGAGTIGAAIGGTQDLLLDGNGLTLYGTLIGNSLGHLLLTTVTASLANDVTLVNANTWVSGPQIALTPGTWMIVGQALVCNLAGGGMTTTRTARLVGNGPTLSSSEFLAFAATGAGCSAMPLTAQVTVAFSTTAGIQAQSTIGTSQDTLRAATLALPSGANATQLTAIRVQ